jgi:DNA repair protein RadB
MQKIELNENQGRSPIGLGCIDSILNGGLEQGVITELFGEGGSGKTNICMQFAINTASQGKKVFYLDSEGFSIERFRQMSVARADIYDNIALFRLNSLEDQELSLIKIQRMMEKVKTPGALILDSFTEYFRLETSGDYQARVSGFQKQLSLILSLITEYRIPALVTNQIYQDIDKGQLQPFGGYVIDHSVKAIIRLEKQQGGLRKATVEKHRSIEEGRSVVFAITAEGLECR